MLGIEYEFVIKSCYRSYCKIKCLLPSNFVPRIRFAPSVLIKFASQNLTAQRR